MAKLKNVRKHQKLSQQQFLQHQQPVQQQNIQKNIKKIKQAPSENNNYMLKRKYDNLMQNYQDQGYYPEVPNLSFPNQLLDCLIKVICSYGNSAKLNQIIKNLSFFYLNEIQEEVLNLVLAESEESGTIYELEEKFKVTDSFFQKPLQKNEQLKTQLKHEDIDDNDQLHSLSNNIAQQDQEIDVEINQLRQQN